MFLIKKAYADILASDLGVRETFGSIASIRNIFVFAFNLLRYLGWAGVIVGVGFALFALVYKLSMVDNEEAVETFKAQLVKAVMIVVTGIILISAGFIVKVVAGLFGSPVTPDIPSVLN